MKKNRAFFPITVVAALIAAGCSQLPKRDPAKAGPFFTPTNVTSLGRLPAEVRRVVVLPSAGNIQVPETSFERLDEAILGELNRTNRFEVVRLTRGQLRQVFGVQPMLSTDALPADLFLKLAEKFGAEAILFTDVTQYSPYPPLSVGLRFKLARLSDRQVLWSADNVFSAATPEVANSARRHALEIGADRGRGDLSHTILQNPSRFVAYAAAESFRSLPTR
jgi:hypothetical protein